MPVTPGSPATHTAPVSAEALGELCAQTIERLDITGAQVAVDAGDTLVYAEAGTANADLGTPVTADTCFQIGSTTKVYTAMLVMQLVDQGRLDLDRPVTDYLPDVRLASTGDWRAITPRHLMSMTSGLDNGPYTDTGRDDASVARYVDLLAEIPLTFAPGSAYGYSNASTIVSGLLVETLTGRCWDDVLRDRLLGPAGLTESVSLFEELPYHRIAVARHDEGTARRWSRGRAGGPSGATLATSARDLVRFGRLFLRRGLAADGTRLLSESAVAAMQTPQVDLPARILADSWCVGMYQKVWAGTEVFGHSGTTGNGSSTLLWIPEHDISIAVIVNTPPRGYPFADAVFDTVLREWLGLAKPPRPAPGAGRPANAERYAGRYDAHGLSYDVVARNGDLVLTVDRMIDHDPATGRHEEPVSTLLRPIAPDRFLPENDAVTSHHTWDIAFTVEDGGHASLLHNGAFTARRTG
jgi:CubicO group peptidase (beta-lactamase class C family)